MKFSKFKLHVALDWLPVNLLFIGMLMTGKNPLHNAPQNPPQNPASNCGSKCLQLLGRFPLLLADELLAVASGFLSLKALAVRLLQHLIGRFEADSDRFEGDLGPILTDLRPS